MRRFAKIVGALATLANLAGCQSTQSTGGILGEGIGVVFMHGRGAFDPRGGSVEALIQSMESYGVTVSTPEMPWAGSNGVPSYTGTMDDALKIVMNEVAALRAKGLKSIIVGGMSAGGNSAIAYGAYVGDVDGIMAIAPAPHTGVIRAGTKDPSFLKRISKLPEKRRNSALARQAARFAEFQRAQSLLASGKGEQPTAFTAYNIGPDGVYSFDITVKPYVYLSYIDPKGKRAMTISAKSLRNKIPLFVGNERPPGGPRNEEMYYSVPRHPKSKLISTNASHLETPTAVIDEVKAWLLSFAPPEPKLPNSSVK